MTPITPAVREMNHQEQVEYGLCTRGLMLEQGEHVYRLSAGATDTVHVYGAGGVTYVLTVNHRLTYVALDWYQGCEVEPIDSLFLQGDYAISECAGSDWRDQSGLELTRQLLQLFA